MEHFRPCTDSIERVRPFGKPLNKLRAGSTFGRHTLVAGVLWLIGSTVALAARPSEELLPNTTKGFVSVRDLPGLGAAWDATQLGKLVADDAMRPFVEDLQRQLQAKFSQAGVRLGVTWEDLSNVASGEVAVGSVQPGLDKTKCATVLLADITNQEQQASQLLAKISNNVLKKGARRSEQQLGGVTFTVFTLAKKKPTDRQIVTYYALHQNTLIAVDDPQVATEIVGRFVGAHTDTLKGLPGFKTTMENSSSGFKGDTHLRWFIEPFGYIEVSRAYAGGRKKRGTDMLKVLASQGFNAVQGLGGHIAFATGDHEIQHRTFIYAPPVKRAAGDTSTDKYNLAARMLDFPNSAKLVPQTWIPERLGTYLTFHWKMQQAFWHSESLVNEIAGDEVFRDVLKSIETDRNGPKINVENEFVRFLGDRATLISDYREPIDPKCERVLFAIEVTDTQSIAATVDKAMESDPNARKIEIKGHKIWEMIQDSEAFAVEEIKIDGVDLGTTVEETAAAEEDEKKFRPNAAVTVHDGHLLIATHVDYLVEVLQQPADAKKLTSAADYKLVSDALGQLGANETSFRVFSRTDHAYRVTYELIRQGKMPESESLFGKLLDGLFAPDDEDLLREQFIDGSKLPDYSKVKDSLGPAGFFVHSDDNGWTITGCLLKK